MLKLRHLIPALMLFAIVLAAPPAPADSEQVGEVLQQRGNVTATRDDTTVTLRAGAPVYQTDRVVTGTEARVKLKFVDGTVVAIGGDSEVALTEYTVIAGNNRLSAVLSLIRGIIRSTVTGGNPPAPFDVRTQAAVASVRSTDWIVEVQNGATAVFVIEGLVAVTTDQPPAAVLLEPEFGTDVTIGAEPKPPTKWNEARVNTALAQTAVE